jgi:hypothetical protein
MHDHPSPGTLDSVRETLRNHRLILHGFILVHEPRSKPCENKPSSSYIQTYIEHSNLFYLGKNIILASEDSFFKNPL